MKTIDLETASSEIQQACTGAQDGRLRYFFLVGAGLSNPPVGLASEIEADCKRTVARYRRATGSPPSNQSMDTYSYWFSKAYPGAKLRQEYLRSLMHGKHISQANFRLAHLLLEKKVSNLVVTTNFDDFLSRALNLFGRQHVVCDHPSTVNRIDPNDPEDIQVIHVHGSYWAYDCANLRGTIAGLAKPATETILGMANLLQVILWQRMPLVIGYSGWEGDVIMTALKRRLNSGEVPFNLYWFCYNRSATNSLPGWLTSNENVCFVVPEAKSTQVPVTEPSLEETGRLSPLTPPQADAKTSAAKGEEEPVLPAQQVLDKLIQTFELSSPKLTSDPLGFFVEQLSSSLPQDDPRLTAVDLYFIKSVVERIERAKQREQVEKGVQRRLSDIREALRESKYRDAIAQAVKIRRKRLTSSELRKLLDAVWSATTLLNDNSEDELRGCEVAFSISELLLKEKSDADLELIIAHALLRKGVILNALGKVEEGISAYDDVFRRFETTTDSRIQERIATALLNKGYALENLPEEEIVAYDEIIKRFSEARDSTLRERVATALVNKGITLGTLKRREEEVATYDKVVEQFGDATETSMRDLVADALVNKGIAFGELGRLNDELAAYDEVIARLAGVTEASSREEVMLALFNKGITLGTAARYKDAISACNELIDRFGEANELSLREGVAQTLINKGLYLGKLGQKDEELAAYDQVVKRFGEASEAALQEQAATAVNAIGVHLISEGKRLWAQGDEALARERLLDAQGKFARGLEIMPNDPMIAANQGYVAFLLGERDRAVVALSKAIEIGGEEIREAKLKDADIHSLPQDEEFRSLLRSVPVSDLGL